MPYESAWSMYRYVLCPKTRKPRCYTHVYTPVEGIAMFKNVPAYPGDPILSLNEDFQRDPRPNKVNLSIGIYFDDGGRLPMMSAVSDVETALFDAVAPPQFANGRSCAISRNRSDVSVRR